MRKNISGRFGDGSPDTTTTSIPGIAYLYCSWDLPGPADYNRFHYLQYKLIRPSWISTYGQIKLSLDLILPNNHPVSHSTIFLQIFRHLRQVKPFQPGSFTWYFGDGSSSPGHKSGPPYLCCTPEPIRYNWF